MPNLARQCKQRRRAATRAAASSCAQDHWGPADRKRKAPSGAVELSSGAAIGRTEREQLRRCGQKGEKVRISCFGLWSCALTSEYTHLAWPQGIGRDREVCYTIFCMCLSYLFPTSTASSLTIVHHRQSILTIPNTFPRPYHGISQSSKHSLECVPNHVIRFCRIR